MKGLILASLILLRPFSAPRGLATELHHDNLTWCDSSGTCYSAHLGKRTFQRAQDACAQFGGELSTASSISEVQAILALLREVTRGSGTTLFWLGLSRKASQCTREDLPLRGFSWATVGAQESPANDTSTSLHWVTEPIKTCIKKRCAGLQVTLGQPLLELWGLVEQACGTASSGYVCKYSYGGTCPAPQMLSGTHHLRYMLPHRLRSLANAEFSPPGTVLALSCSAGWETRFTCQHSPDGYHWEGKEQGLCSCPMGLWSPTKGNCVAPGDCLSTQGTFLCLCTWGSRLQATEGACLSVTGDAATMTVRLGLSTPSTSGSAVLNSTSQPGLNNSLGPFPPEVGNSSDTGTDKATTPPIYSNYVFILVTVAVVFLVILIMAALQVFEVCSRACFPSKGSQEKKEGAPAASAEGDLGTSGSRSNSEYSLGPSKAELGEVCLDEPKPEVE